MKLFLIIFFQIIVTFGVPQKFLIQKLKSWEPLH